MDLFKLKSIFNLKVSGVVHVGAHLAEEAQIYESLNWVPVYWVEAQEQHVKVIKNTLDPKKHKVINAVIWHQDNDELSFNIATNSQSSSLLDFGSHKQVYPEISILQNVVVKTTTLDTIFKNIVIPNFLVLDIQGAEYHAIRGLKDNIQLVDYIYTEINKEEVYIGCLKIKDFDNFLDTLGFKRVATEWMIRKGWGEALYIRKNLISKSNMRLLKFKISRFYKLVKAYCRLIGEKIYFSLKDAFNLNK